MKKLGKKIWVKGGIKKLPENIRRNLDIAHCLLYKNFYGDGWEISLYCQSLDICFAYRSTFATKHEGEKALKSLCVLLNVCGIVKYADERIHYVFIPAE